jgi:hypothetical protein
MSHRPHPLSLSDQQLQCVLAAAASLRPQFRDRYLNDIADQLTARVVTDHAVRQAIVQALARMGAVA